MAAAAGEPTCQCKARGAIVWPIPINFSRNDRNVGGRLGLQHGLGGLVAPDHAGDSDMVGGRGPASPARASLSGIHAYPISLSILVLNNYPNYPTLISVILNTYPNYPTYLVIYPTYPLHAYVADK